MSETKDTDIAGMQSQSPEIRIKSWDVFCEQRHTDIKALAIKVEGCDKFDTPVHERINQLYLDIRQKLLKGEFIPRSYDALWNYMKKNLHYQAQRQAEKQQTENKRSIVIGEDTYLTDTATEKGRPVEDTVSRSEMRTAFYNQYYQNIYVTFTPEEALMIHLKKNKWTQPAVQKLLPTQAFNKSKYYRAIAKRNDLLEYTTGAKSVLPRPSSSQETIADRLEDLTYERAGVTIYDCPLPEFDPDSKTEIFKSLGVLNQSDLLEQYIPLVTVILAPDMLPIVSFMRRDKRRLNITRQGETIEYFIIYPQYDNSKKILWLNKSGDMVAHIKHIDDKQKNKPLKIEIDHVYDKGLLRATKVFDRYLMSAMSHRYLGRPSTIVFTLNE